MARTFEEQITDKIDALYQGCLFLEGGDEARAERLLVSSSTRAFREHTPAVSGDRFHSWLEGRLVAAFLESPESVPSVRTAHPDHPEPDGISRVFDAAGRIPALSRAALWLVLFRRWSYRDAAHVLEVARERVPELLSNRTSLMHAMHPDAPDATRGTGS